VEEISGLVFWLAEDGQSGEEREKKGRKQNAPSRSSTSSKLAFIFLAQESSTTSFAALGFIA
jgi:hypothetical protein